ncbi:hypothetical protein FRB97_003092 [Tulasnella sp. 331]|nr:hypothetical protein FRB97_003092 [Tulasnella sp. 331]KAG8890143.1 hypothetical protein FRB98_000871 [Tulasnella sp. 332]
MAGKKRGAAEATTDGDAHPESPGRQAKVAKVTKVASDAEKPKSKGKRAASPKKAAPKTIVPTAAQFKEHALPLHVNITHTPPSVEAPAEHADTTPNTSTDSGHVASITLTPSVFSTGSFGWKGSRKIAVELLNAEGVKETVMVNMSFNATVAGSKPAAKATKGARKTRSKGKAADEDDEEDDEEDEEE